MAYFAPNFPANASSKRAFMLPEGPPASPLSSTSRRYFISLPLNRHALLGFFVCAIAKSLFELQCRLFSLIVKKFGLPEIIDIVYFRLLAQKVQDVPRRHRIADRTELGKHPFKKSEILGIIQGHPHSIEVICGIVHLELRDLEKPRIGEVHPHHFGIRAVLYLAHLRKRRGGETVGEGAAC